MNDLESFENGSNTIPVSFKVIGIGSEAATIIEEVKKFGYDCVECLTTDSPDNCIPTDDDKMAIIVACDDVEVANKIAKNYHDAGVLTIGLLYDANSICYDSIVKYASLKEFPDIIKSLLQPIVTQGYICYDFNDLCMTLRDTGFFMTLAAEGKIIENTVINMQKSMEEIDLNKVGYLSAHLYFNRQIRPYIKMSDMSYLSEMLSRFPDSVNVIWSVRFDDTLPTDIIKFTIIMAGKELK